MDQKKNSLFAISYSKKEQYQAYQISIIIMKSLTLIITLIFSLITFMPLIEGELLNNYSIIILLCIYLNNICYRLYGMDPKQSGVGN